MCALEFFDCNCEFGPYRTKVYRYAETADALLEEMNFCNINRALVFHTAQRFDSAPNGNQRVLEEIAGHSRLLPTWTLLPSHTGEMPAGEALVAEMREQGVKALRLFHNEHRYFMDAMTWRDQLPVYEERRIPLFIRARLDYFLELLKNFPNLTIVAGTQGFNPMDRYAWPMIAEFPNLFYETSSYLCDGVLEEFCDRYTADRLIFGSGYPENMKGTAMFRLVRADLSDEQKSAIASKNLDRLLSQADFS